MHNEGLCDGWLRSVKSDEYAIGYYTEEGPFASSRKGRDRLDHLRSVLFADQAVDVPEPFLHALGRRLDRLDNSFAPSGNPAPFAPSELPTIWDRLADAALSTDVTTSATCRSWPCGAPSICRSRGLFVVVSWRLRGGDCSAYYSSVEPRFLEESTGISSDDHPHADIRNGQAFLNTVYDAVVSSPAFERTVLVINLRRMGRFLLDHVPPPVGARP